VQQQFRSEREPQVFAHDSPTWSPKTVSELADKAGLVVEASVREVLPSRVNKSSDELYSWLNEKAGEKINLETDIVLDIAQTLKGTSPGEKLVLTTAGGRTASGLLVAFSRLASAKPGARLVLFLNEVSASEFGDNPSVPSLPWYRLVSDFGALPIEGGQLHLESHSKEFQRRYQGVNAEEVFTEIRAIR
jgi:hypothetical protein